jgi:hypothetical protein
LARDAAPARSAPARGTALPASPLAPHAHATFERGQRQLRTMAPSERARRAESVRAEVPIERRRPSTDIALRIERAVKALGVRRPLPAAHTVDVGGGRVRLLVHNDGRSTRIVALCSPPLRDQVERALARARFTLAAGGFAVGAP